MPTRHIRRSLPPAVAIAVACFTIASMSAANPNAAASSLKGSSCSHPYRVYVGQPKLSIGVRLLGDTGFITEHHRALPRHSVSAPIRVSYSWHGLNGAHMCEFRFWITEAYRIGTSGRFKKPVTLETPLDSHNPNGGKNVVVTYKEHCGISLCGDREGMIEWHEVLTAAG